MSNASNQNSEQGTELDSAINDVQSRKVISLLTVTAATAATACLISVPVAWI